VGEERYRGKTGRQTGIKRSAMHGPTGVVVFAQCMPTTQRGEWERARKDGRFREIRENKGKKLEKIGRSKLGAIRAG